LGDVALGTGGQNGPPGGGKQFNPLIHEKSPHLLQHARNPVNWYPWGPEAFAQARKENKPIFLSMGYSTCHWCHVMERESFEREDVAEILNKHFIAIKVDREERPGSPEQSRRAEPSKEQFYQRRIAELEKHNADFLAQVSKLTEQVARLSKNSSKPPSSDIVKPPKPDNPKGPRHQGGQPRHRGVNRPRFAPTRSTASKNFIRPRPKAKRLYKDLYAQYMRLYPALKDQFARMAELPA